MHSVLEATVLLLILATGFLAGLASGLFGVGGGVLMVPAALYLVPGTDFHLAKAASLVVIVASAAIGVWTHHRHRSVAFGTGALLALGGLAGAAVSVLLLERVADGTLAALFGLFLAATGAHLILAPKPRPRRWGPARERAYLVALGLVAGLLAGAFGVGGGIVMVPGLVVAGVGMHLAVGTSLVAVLGNAAGGTAAHLALGYGPALAALGVPLALGAVPGTHLGSRLAHRLHADRLKRLFGAFLVLVGLAMALETLLS